MADDPNEVTTIDLRDPQTLVAMVNDIEPPPSFLLDTYFPCDPDTDIFNTTSVLIDYDTCDKETAPFIRVGFLNSDRSAFNTDEFEPARIAESRLLKIDHLNKRGFGEAVFSKLAPDQRAAAIATRDFIEMMSRIKRTQEIMAANCLMYDGYECQYIDKDGKETEKVSIAFHGETNDCQYTPDVPWDGGGANILGDLTAMSTVMTDNGCEVSDAIVGSDVASLIISDEKIQKLFDIRKYEMGNIDPKLQKNGAIVLGLINVNGVLLRVIQYSKKYKAASGKLEPYIPAGRVIMTAPGAGKCLYGAVTQIDEADGPFVTHADRYVPKYISDQRNDIREFMLSSCPLVVPKKKGCWISADVLAPPSA